MPTLAQVLQEQPTPAPLPHLETVVSATMQTVQTTAGPIVNGTHVVPAAGKHVVVLRVEGLDVVIAALP